MEQQRSFTGRSRRRTTRKGVVLADGMARVLISTGGIGTIVAVMGVCIFLVWVVVPLFQSAEVSEPRFVISEMDNGQLLHVAVDEYQAMGWLMLPDSTVQGFRIDTGEVLVEKKVAEDREITCFSCLVSDTRAALGFADGTVQLIDIGFATSYYDSDGVPDDVRSELAEKPPGSIAAMGGGIVQLTPEGQYRQQILLIEEVESASISDGPIRLIDHVELSDGPVIAVLAGSEEAFELKTIVCRQKEDFMTGGMTLEFEEPETLPKVRLAKGCPEFLEISSRGNDIYAAWRSGEVIRVRRSGEEGPFIAEKGRLTESGAELTSFGMILGDNTLIWGDSHGAVKGGFLVPVESFTGQDLHDVVRDGSARFAFVESKILDRLEEGETLISMAPSGHSRLIACGFSGGKVRIYNVTSASTIATLDVPGEMPVLALTTSPKEDGFIAVTPDSVFHCFLDPLHSEAGMAALFLPVWYEDYAEPQHMWQSSSATDDTEPKLGLMPLVFGSVKATFYAMLFGAPLALLAAIYSSEFLNPRAKAAVKPTIELMASLPSVVLGFLAALVFAPFVEKMVPTVFLLLLCVPFAILFCAYVWQLLPSGRTRRVAGLRPLIMVVPILLGILLALVVGPMVEQFFFDGDIKGWLAWDPGAAAAGGDGRFAGGMGGWLLLCLPVSAFAAALLGNRLVLPWIRRITVDSGRTAAAWLDLLRFTSVSLLAIGLALAMAALFDGLGLDLRGDCFFWHTDVSPLDTYVQRNALIVGFVMGFAVIPIIYTIADDALSAVPEHLRSGSLGTGATPWQTAVRIVVPTAMSGLFSALMIGLGRAVGETMIVLMALGNTAIMDWNVFNGARTLSANIAVELPEAVRNSTHYRTLFLAALVLFAMTFVINTLAEVVRLRFRKRAVQL